MAETSDGAPLQIDALRYKEHSKDIHLSTTESAENNFCEFVWTVGVFFGVPFSRSVTNLWSASVSQNSWCIAVRRTNEYDIVPEWIEKQMTLTAQLPFHFQNYFDETTFFDQ